MASISKVPTKSVFVGNIPYGLTEEQITDIFNSAGKVVSFRLVYDRETGRPKGFGFAEYTDSDSAASAVRNLNDHEIMNRKLRVDFSNDIGGDDDNAPPGYLAPPIPSNGVPVPPAGGSSILPPLPVGVDLPSGLTCPDAISRTLNTLPPSQLLDVLSQMKTLVTTDPAKATALLSQAPQLSYAIFQALLLMDLVSTEALTSVIEQASAPTPVPAPPAMPYGQAPAYAAGYPARNTPPVHNMPYQPPPAAYPPAGHRPALAPPAPAQPDTDALVQQVMAMPQSLIDQLPPAERAQLMALKAQFMQQGR